MINNIRIPNFPYQTQARSLLREPVLAGDDEIQLQNIQGFSNEKFLVLGDVASERCEIQEISSIETGTHTIVLASGVQFDHSKDGATYCTPYDRIELYKADSVGGVIPDEEDYSLLADLSIDFEALFTVFEDNAGTNNRYYKFKYTNSVSDEESLFEDVEAENNIGYCSVAYVQNLLRINDNAGIISTLIDAASDFIDSEINIYPARRRLYIQEVTEYLDTKYKKRTYFVRNRPIVELISATVMSQIGEVEGAYEDHIHVYPRWIKLTRRLYDRPKGLKLVYKSGFFERGDTPKDLELLCARLVISEFKRYQNGQDPTVASKKIGGYTVTYNKETIKSEMIDLETILAKYRDNIQFTSI